MSSAKQIAVKSVDNIDQLLADMFDGDYANNEVSLGVLDNNGEAIQVQLKVTRAPSEFIETEYYDLEGSHKKL